MNLLVDTPPVSVLIGGTEYPISTDFRASVLFEMLMTDEDVSDMEKVEYAFSIYFPNGLPKEDPLETMKAIIWFYRCGRSDKERKIEKARKEGDTEEDSDEEEPDYDTASSAKAYSFDYDDEYIYSAFMEQYGINLVKVPYLHWWEFRALFKGLRGDCELCKIMSYRTTKITSSMSKTEKAFLRKMKSLHALPVSKTEKEATEALADALINGRDIDALLGHSEDGNE